MDNKTPEAEPSTIVNGNPIHDEFQELIEEATRLRELIKSSKTGLKKAYYEKKLEKIKQKTYRSLISKAIANPSLLKKREESNE